MSRTYSDIPDVALNEIKVKLSRVLLTVVTASEFVKYKVQSSFAHSDLLREAHLSDPTSALGVVIIRI